MRRCNGFSSETKCITKKLITSACAVPDDDTDTVIIISLYDEVISRYNKDGFVEHISPPSPFSGSCSYYRQDDGTMVGIQF